MAVCTSDLPKIIYIVYLGCILFHITVLFCPVISRACKHRFTQVLALNVVTQSLQGCAKNALSYAVAGFKTGVTMFKTGPEV